MSVQAQLYEIYARLSKAYGPQHWWPADSPFEVMVGAILTQNTSWKNVEKAIEALKQKRLLDAKKIVEADPEFLAQCIRSSGFYRQKASRLKAFCRFYLTVGGIEGMRGRRDIRQKLLAIHGIGHETADSILLYALDVPVFVIDAYTRRIFSRLGLCSPSCTYQQLQSFFMDHLARDCKLFNEYHALIVAHGKRHCRTRPLCSSCPLSDLCMGAATAASTYGNR